MDKKQEYKVAVSSLLEAIFPTETGISESITESKTLIIMIIVGCILFGGLTLFLIKMASMQ